MEVDPPSYELRAGKSALIDCGGSTGVTAAKAHTSWMTSSSSCSSSTNSNSDESDGEGQDPPSYTPALTVSGILQMKPEFISPFCRSKNRSWRKCIVELNNTQLKLIYPRYAGFCTTAETFSLQFAEVGLATDYEKRPHSFRLRVETQQLMFSCESRNMMLKWMVSLQMAISLALPLELRQLPEEVRRRRNRQRELQRRREREEELRNQHFSASSASSGATSQYQQSSPRRRSRKNVSQINPDNEKWEPRRRKSRFSEKDFPHLLFNSPWEGKSVLFHGQWALIRDRKLVFVQSKKVPPPADPLKMTTNAHRILALA